MISYHYISNAFQKDLVQQPELNDTRGVPRRYIKEVYEKTYTAFLAKCDDVKCSNISLAQKNMMAKIVAMAEATYESNVPVKNKMMKRKVLVSRTLHSSNTF